jgi:3-deoxy-D-manno-octulosonic-acid transferase
VPEIKLDLNKLHLKIHTHEPRKKIDDNIDIYLVNSYGQTKSFYSNCKNIFLGGSIVNHGGQNPLEATRYGCNILHGPNISNFDEIYKHLKKMNISSQINSQKTIINKLENFFNSKRNFKKIQAKLRYTGLKILNSTYREIKFIIR